MAQRSQKRLDELFTKYYESDFKKLCERYDELCEQYKVDKEKRKDLRKLETYSKMITLSVSALRQAIAKEIKSITPKEVVEGAKKRKLERKQKEMDKKKRKYQKSHGLICSKCGGRNFLGIFHKYCDAGHCVLPSGKELDGYSPAFTGICDSDQMLMNICVDCGAVHGLDVENLKTQIDSSDNQQALLSEEGESSTDEVFDYGIEGNDDEESSDDSDEEEEE